MDDRAGREPLQKRLAGAAVGELPAGQEKRVRAAFSAAQRVDLRGPPAARAAERLDAFPRFHRSHSDAR